MCRYVEVMSVCPHICVFALLIIPDQTALSATVSQLIETGLNLQPPGRMYSSPFHMTSSLRLIVRLTLSKSLILVFLTFKMIAPEQR